MTFTSADTHRRTKINDDIVNILKQSRGTWMSASDIAGRIRGRTDSHGVGQRMKYLLTEYPIETYMKLGQPHVRMYRYVEGEPA